MNRNDFIDWLYFDRRHKVTTTTNDNKQKIYTARNGAECLTFGQATDTAPLVVRWIHYKPNGTPDRIKYFANYTDTVQHLNNKRRAKN